MLSGNPGYIPQKPLIVAQGDSNGVKLVLKSGFNAISSDSKGLCVNANVQGAFGVILKYGKDDLLSCKAQGITSIDSFKNYCEKFDISNLAIV